MIKGVIFDMDGVLVDNRDIHIESFARWCKTRGLDIDKNVLISYFGMGNSEIFPAILSRDDLSAADIAMYGQEKEAIYRDMYAPTIAPVSGLVELLKSLKSKDIRIAVGSSGMRKNVDYVLQKCGIASYFDIIIDGDQLHRAKPDPEVFLLGADAMGLTPAECVVCEDSFAGISAARAAGTRVVALATTFSRDEHSDYDLLIDDFTQTSAEELLAL